MRARLVVACYVFDRTDQAEHTALGSSCRVVDSKPAVGAAACAIDSSVCSRFLRIGTGRPGSGSVKVCCFARSIEARHQQGSLVEAVES